MTDAPNRTSEIAAYLAAVERHLGDLPEPIRLDLMSELDTHLAEVAADLGPGMTLRDLLGTPEAYARELRETAEVQKDPVRTRLRRSLLTAAAPAAARARTAADRFAASTGHADAAELAVRLRPGWWVLRGALVAVLFVYWLASAQFGVTGYSFVGSLPGLLFGVAALLLGVWISLKVGAKTPEWGRRQRRWTAAAGITILALAAFQFSWVLTGGIPTVYTETQYVQEPDYERISDIRVYDENGEPLTDVYLFDQDGNPLWIGDPSSCNYETWNDPFAEEPEFDSDEFGDRETDAIEGSNSDGSEHGYQYPLCAAEDDAAAEPSPGEGTPSETPTETAPPTDEPTTEESPSPDEPTADPTPSEDAPTTK